MSPEPTASPRTTSDRATWPRWRTWTVRIWYGLLSVWLLAMSHHAVLVLVGRIRETERFAYTAVTAWKVLALGGVFVVCWTGGRSVLAFSSVAAGHLAWFTSDLLHAVHPADATPVLSTVATVVLWLLPLFVLHPRRRDLLRVDLHPSAIMLPLALAGAVPLCLYAIHHGSLATGQNGPIEIRYSAAGLGIVLAVQATYAALRPHANPWFGRAVAAAIVWIGAAAVLWPDDLTSPGRVWGTALLGWAALYALANELETRRQPRHSEALPRAADSR